MSTPPAPTMYHRWLGWHAVALRRLAIAAVFGIAVGSVVGLYAQWEVAVLSSWDACAAVFLVTVWGVIVRADGERTRQLAMREDETSASARVLLVTASLASLFAVGFLLGAAGQASGGRRVLLITIATATVVLSWIVVNTVFTLRYADLYFASGPVAIDFWSGGPAQNDIPDYRDFAYVAFGIGMTYQVADTTLRDRRIRHMVLGHSLMAYVFGVVIVATGVNLVSGLVS